MKSEKSPLDEDCGVLAYVKVSNKGLDEAICDWGVLSINRDKSMKSEKSPLDEDCGVLAYVKVSNKGLDEAIRDLARFIRSGEQPQGPSWRQSARG